MNALPTAGQDLPLRDIHAPAPPGVWPPAPGWWVLAGVGLVLLGFGLWWLYRRYRLARRRRRILDQLAGLPGRATGALLAAEVSALLKRVALARYPRTEVASLTGTPWLELLDRTGGGGRFVQGPGRVLAEGPYAPAPDFDADALLALAGDWIRRNL
jgi:hypothetical protein